MVPKEIGFNQSEMALMQLVCIAGYCLNVSFKMANCINLSVVWSE